MSVEKAIRSPTRRLTNSCLMSFHFHYSRHRRPSLETRGCSSPNLSRPRIPRTWDLRDRHPRAIPGFPLPRSSSAPPISARALVRAPEPPHNSPAALRIGPCTVCPRISLYSRFPAGRVASSRHRTSRQPFSTCAFFNGRSFLTRSEPWFPCAIPPPPDPNRGGFGPQAVRRASRIARAPRISRLFPRPAAPRSFYLATLPPLTCPGQGASRIHRSTTKLLPQAETYRDPPAGHGPYSHTHWPSQERSDHYDYDRSTRCTFHSRPHSGGRPLRRLHTFTA
jgi:hypothetical protein